MSNTLLTPQMITRENLLVLHQKLNFVSKVDRQYDDRFAVSGAKIGTTLNVRKPAKYTVSTGTALSTQDSTDTYMPLTVTTQKHVDITFSSAELTMSVDNWMQRYGDPAMAVLAASIEADALSGLYKKVYQSAGSASAPANAMRPFLTARKYLKNSLVPEGDLMCIMNTDTNVEMVDSLKGLLNPNSNISDQYKQGLLAQAAGFNFYENTLLPVHTAGAQGGTPLSNAVSPQTGSSIVTDGWSNSITGVLKAGDVITFADVYAVHPETKATLGYLQQFVVTADVDSDGSGNATIGISPSIVSSGAFQNVSNGVANNKAISVVGSSGAQYGINLCFHKNAFTFATADLEDVSQYGAWGAREAYDGISLRVAKQYAIGTDTVPCRFDVLYGYAELYPQLAARVINQPSAT